jgi:uncharacterized protein YndB with AHSA1/START domain
MEQEQTRWTQFELLIRIQASREAIYLAWATEVGICSWFLKSAGAADAEHRPIPSAQPLSVGNTYTWQWHNNDFTLDGKVIQVDRDSVFGFTFIDPCKVRIELTDTENGTLVRLCEFDIPDDEEHRYSRYLSDKVKWTFWLTQLKAWLEHGIKLNETQSSMKSLGSDLVVNQ